MTPLKDWVEEKIRDENIDYFEYSEFSNISKIGKGGFGIVNRADFTSSGIQVALKMLLNTTVKGNDIEELAKEV
jgi:serine/threonine protein kinase